MLDLAELKGIIPAMVTPLTEQGSLDLDQLQVYLDFLLEKGITGVFPGGTAGEGVMLTTDEREELLEAVVKHLAGSVPVLAHVGALTTAEVIRLSRHAEDHGAAAVSVVSPFYYTYSEQELVDHYAAVVEATSSIPVYFYNIPSHTGRPIPISTIRQLLANPRIAGIKDSGGDERYLEELCQMQNDQFTVLVGADRLGFKGMKFGARGMVSSFAGVFPESYLDLWHAMQAGDQEAGAAHQKRIDTLVATMYSGLPLNVYKDGLAFRDLPVGQARRPIGPLSPEARSTMEAELRELGYLS